MPDLFAALRDCFDPQLRCNVVDLGMVIDATLAIDLDAPGAGIRGVPERHIARVILLPVVHDESYEVQLSAVVSNRLAGLSWVSRSKVRFDYDTLWTPERITPEGRRLLQLDMQPRGELIQIKIP